MDNVREMGIKFSNKAELRALQRPLRKNPESLDKIGNTAGWAAVVTSILGLGPATLSFEGW